MCAEPSVATHRDASSLFVSLPFFPPPPSLYAFHSILAFRSSPFRQTLVVSNVFSMMRTFDGFATVRGGNIHATPFVRLAHLSPLCFSHGRAAIVCDDRPKLVASFQFILGDLALFAGNWGSKRERFWSFENFNKIF